MVSRIRRLSRTAKKQKVTKAQMDAQIDRLQSIARDMEAVKLLQADIAREEAELFAFMNDNDIDHIPAEGCVADIVQSAGKSTNIIDPKGLRKLLKSDEEYYSCISVSVTKTKELLAGKELDKITTTIPGTPGPRKLKVSLVEVK